jgi:hypothetical protein
VHQFQRPASRLRHPASWCIWLFMSMATKLQISKQVVTSRNNVIYHTAKSDSAHDLQYQARLQNCERRLSTSSCLSVCPSVRPHGTTRLPLDGFSWNLVFDYSSKVCRENSSFITIWQEKRVICMKTTRRFLIISRSLLLRMRHASKL